MVKVLKVEYFYHLLLCFWDVKSWHLVVLYFHERVSSLTLFKDAIIWPDTCVRLVCFVFSLYSSAYIVRYVAVISPYFLSVGLCNLYHKFSQNQIDSTMRKG